MVKRIGGILNYTVIKPKKGWQLIDIKELKEYKDLLYFWVMREIKIRYKQTVLGFTWALIRPVASMVVFTVVFGNMAKVPSDGIPYPIFSYAALMPWTYFSQSLSKSTQSLITQANVISKIYFPRIIIPMAPVLAGLLDFLLSFIVLIIMMFAYGIVPTAQIFFLPLLILLMILTASGMGMWMSALGIQYRDVRQAIQFVVRLLMYATPVVWPVSLVAEKFGHTAKIIYGIYPMAGVIEGFRSALIGKNPMPWDLILMGSIGALVVFKSGAFYFQRMEKNFADVA